MKLYIHRYKHPRNGISLRSPCHGGRGTWSHRGGVAATTSRRGSRSWPPRCGSLGAGLGVKIGDFTGKNGRFHGISVVKMRDFADLSKKLGDF